MNVLIAGIGSIAKKHISALRAIDPAVRIMGLRSSAASAPVESVEDVYSIGSLSASPDFAIISNPTYRHIQTIEEFLALDIPLFIEKPLAHGLDGLQECVEAVRLAGTVTYLACNLRFHPVIRYLKSHIAGKRLNEVNVYCGSYLPEWRNGADFRNSYSSRPEMGGGVHLDLIHEMDYCYWLFGKPLHAHSFRTSDSSLGIAAADHAHYNLRYTDFSVSIILNYYRRDEKRQIELVFEDQTWICDLIHCRIIDGAGKIVFERNDFQMMETYHAQMQYFLDSLRAGSDMMNSVKEGAEVLALALYE
jgi:predicted dehydrogenase